MSGGFNDPESMGLIGDDKVEVSKESFSHEGFNDPEGFTYIPNEKKEVNGSDKTQDAGFNDSDSIIDSGHMSG